MIAMTAGFPGVANREWSFATDSIKHDLPCQRFGICNLQSKIRRLEGVYLHRRAETCEPAFAIGS
jgi:hypothetical protein